MRPWDKYLPQAREENAWEEYADYGAWELWMDEQRIPPANTTWEHWQEMSVLDRIPLYSIMCRVADGAPDPCVTSFPQGDVLSL